MDKETKNNFLESLRANLVVPMKRDLQSTKENISLQETEIKKLKQRFLFFKILLVIGICLHLWCGFMTTYSWLWVIYLLALLIL